MASSNPVNGILNSIRGDVVTNVMVDEVLVLRYGKVTFIVEMELIAETQQRAETLAGFLE